MSRIAVVGMALALGACASRPAPTVEIRRFSFRPRMLEVARGATVSWTNEDDTTHTVTAAAFGSGHLALGGTFTRAFNERETFAYACEIHPSMRGEVRVA